MRFGLAIVTNLLGMQGMALLERELPVWPDPEAFAKAAMMPPTDDSAWSRHRPMQSEYVHKDFSQHALCDYLVAEAGALQPEHARNETITALLIE